MLTLAASACLTMLVSASWTMRYSVVSTSGGRRSSPSCASRRDSDVGRLRERLARVARERRRVRSRRAPSASAGRPGGGRPAASRPRAHGGLKRLAEASSELPRLRPLAGRGGSRCSAWPVSSCSSRARRRRSSSWPPTTRRSASRATRRERSTAIAAWSRETARRAAGRSSLKRWSRPSLSCATSDADRHIAQHQWNVETRPRAEQSNGVLVHLRILEQRIDALAMATLEDAAGLRCVTWQRWSRSEIRPFLGVCSPRRRSSPAGSAIVTRRAPIRSRSRRAMRSSSRGQLQLADQRSADLVQRLELRVTTSSTIRRGARSPPRRRPARRAA